MASLTESEYASVPLARLERLQQEILQEQRVASENDDTALPLPLQPHPHPASKDDFEPVIQESANAYRTPFTSPRTEGLKIPRLEAAKSAPPAEMEAMMDATSPQQELFRAMGRASSFHGYPGGDTQPMESQVYKDFSESVRMSRTTDATTPKRDKMLLQVSPEGKVDMYTYDTQATAKTPRTCQEGDTGYVDLAKAWQEDTQEDTTSQMEDFLLEHSPETQLPSPNLFRKPAMPETPHLAGNKRRRSGEVLTSQTTAKRTPGFSQLFGVTTNKDDMLSATQLFNQTQQPSSPVPEGPRSDPVLTRPSPQMNLMTHSSPAPMVSSPMVAMNRLLVSAGEPRDNYTSLLESQERREAARLRQEQESQNGTIDDFDDYDDDLESRRFRSMRLERARSAQTLAELTKLRAPSRPKPRPATSSSPHKRTTIDLTTPATTKKGEVDFEVSDDEASDEEAGMDGDVAEESRVVEDAEEMDEDDENDVYDELAQTVLRSQGPCDEEDGSEDDDGSVRQEHDDDMDGQDDEQDEIGETTVDEVGRPAPRRTLVQGSSQPDRNLQRRSQTTTQHSAIADSQPLQFEEKGRQGSQSVAEKSPSRSYIPGSQYAGKTSQDQAQLSQKQMAVSMGPPTLSMSKSEEMPLVVPSSPPLATTGGSTLETKTDARFGERRTDQPFPEETTTEDCAEQEIPESDQARPNTAVGNQSRPMTAESRPQDEGNNAPFSTARSHVSTTNVSPKKTAPPTPLKALASQQSKTNSQTNSQTPRTKAGVRRFADIAGAPLQGTSAGLNIDLDALMSDVITAEDREIFETLASPPKQQYGRKRRVASERARAPPAKKARLVEPEPMASLDGQLDEPLDATGGESPSKANERRVFTPPAEELEGLTSESVRLREEAGSRAASQLLANRSGRSKKPSKLSGTGRKADAKAQAGANAPDADDGPRKRAKTAKPQASSTGGTVEDEAATATTEPEVEETVVEITKDDDRAEEVGPVAAPAVVAPHRVFALFKGIKYNMFYTATWLGAAPNGSGHRVKFDDGTVATIEPHLVCCLELRENDQIKFDLEGMKNKIWVVKGFGEPLRPDAAQKKLTTISGHETVKVQARSGRGSVAGAKDVPQGEGEMLDVAVEYIYLTHSMWSHFSDRYFQPAMGRTMSARFATPSTGVQTPVDSETPTSRARRTYGSTAKALEKRASSLREDFAVSSKLLIDYGLFSGMAFAISFGQNEAEKTRITRLIQRNGGLILDDGFEELFDAPNLGEADVTNPAKKADDSAGLRLKPHYQDLGFVALIADKHSRRAKYIQALALGIPTLSGRWITDSLDALKNPSLSGAEAAPLAWPKYALAAGESSYLSGAIRCRNLAPYNAVDARLEATIANREILLDGDGVLIVAAKKSKAVWERRKAFAFLTLALGAGHVRRVADLREAKAAVEGEGERWRFVYVDGSVAEASAVVFGKGGEKKRKREEGKVDVKAMSASDGGIRIVNDEFVVQSLILGALVD